MGIQDGFPSSSSPLPPFSFSDPPPHLRCSMSPIALLTLPLGPSSLPLPLPTLAPDSKSMKMWFLEPKQNIKIKFRFQVCSPSFCDTSPLFSVNICQRTRWNPPRPPKTIKLSKTTVLRFRGRVDSLRIPLKVCVGSSLI